MKKSGTDKWIEDILYNFITEQIPLYKLSASVKAKLCAIISNNPIFLGESQAIFVYKTRKEIEHVLSMRWNKTNIKSLSSLIETANKTDTWDQYRPNEVKEILYIEENILENVRDEIALAKDELSTLKMKISQAKNYIQQIILTIGDLSSLFSLPQIDAPILEIVDKWISNQDGSIATDVVEVVTPEQFNGKIGEPLVKLIDIEVSEVSDKEKQPLHNNARNIPRKNVYELYNTLLQYALFKTDNDKIAHELIQSSMPRIWWYMQINEFQSWSNFLKEILIIIDRNWKKNYKNNEDYCFDKSSDDFISREEYNILIQDISDWMKPALLTLTDKEKTVIDMRYNQKLSFVEISTILGGSKSLSAVIVNFAFKKIEDSLFNLSVKKEVNQPQELPIFTWTPHVNEEKILPKYDNNWNDKPEDLGPKVEINTDNNIVVIDRNIHDKPIKTEKVVIKKSLHQVYPIQKNWKNVLEHNDLDILQWSIFGYIIKMVKDQDIAQDLTQEVLIKIWKKLDTGEYEEKWTFLSWAFRIAHNYTIDYFRNNKKKGIQISMTDYIENNVVEHPKEKPIEDIIIKEEIEKQLRIAITKLSPEQRETIQLRIYDELSFKEIAEKMWISINTALWRFRYAHKNLSKILWYTSNRKLRHNSASDLNEPISKSGHQDNAFIQKTVSVSRSNILNEPDITWKAVWVHTIAPSTNSDINTKIETDFSTFNSIIWEQIDLPIIVEGTWEENPEWVLQQYHDLLANLDKKSLTSLKSKIVAKCTVYDTSKSCYKRYIEFLSMMETMLDKIIYN